MMPVKIIADTCAWIDFFNGRQTQLVDALEQALVDGSAITCGVILYELLQGIRNKREAELILRAFEALPHIEMNRGLWIRAGELSSRLRIQGVTIPFSDILIASIALENRLAVLTIDRHFEQIPGVKVIRTP